MSTSLHSNSNGATTGQLTVTLAKTYTANKTVALHSSSPAFAIPTNVKVLAGNLTASVPFTVNSVTEDTTTTVVANLGTSYQECAFAIYANPTSLGMSTPSVTPGNGCARIDFEPLYPSTDLTYSLRIAFYTTIVLPGGQVQQVPGTLNIPVANGLAYLRQDGIPTTASSLLVRATYADGVTLDSPSVPITWLSTGPTLTVTSPPASLVGTWGYTIAASSGAINRVSLTAKGRDLQTIPTAAGQTNSSQFSSTLDTTYLNDGTLNLWVFGEVDDVPATTAVAVPSTSIQNGFSNIIVDEFAYNDKSDLGTVQADFPSATTSWKVQVKNYAGTIVNSASGTGAQIRWCWSGLDTAGTAAACDTYTATISYTVGGVTKTVDRSVSIIYPNPNFIGLIYRFGAHTGDLQYARELIARVLTYNSVWGGGLPVLRPAIFCKSGDARTTPKFKQQLKDWIAKSGEYFYLDSHGWGEFQTTAPVHEAYWADIVFGNYISFSTKKYDGFLCIPTLVTTPRYKFVWMDNCQSAGWGSLNPAQMTETPDGAWAGAWKIASSHGAMLGWNGNAAQMFDNATGAANEWYRWSIKMWDYLLVQNYSLTDAIYYAAWQTNPPYVTSFQPWATINTSFGGIAYKLTYYGYPFQFP